MWAAVIKHVDLVLHLPLSLLSCTGFFSQEGGGVRLCHIDLPRGGVQREKAVSWNLANTGVTACTSGVTKTYFRAALGLNGKKMFWQFLLSFSTRFVAKRYISVITIINLFAELII